jgi:hypothetical protein
VDPVAAAASVKGERARFTSAERPISNRDTPEKHRVDADFVR